MNSRELESVVREVVVPVAVAAVAAVGIMALGALLWWPLFLESWRWWFGN